MFNTERSYLYIKTYKLEKQQQQQQTTNKIYNDIWMFSMWKWQCWHAGF